MDRRTVLGAGAASLVGAASGCATLAQDSLAALLLPVNPLHKLAFGSCLDQAKPQPIWEAVLAERPELFIFGGDNVYASATPWHLDTLQRAYAQLQQSPGFRRLRATVPTMAIWDDNDYGANDGGVEFEHKQASKDAFLAFWGAAPDDPRRAREGIYHAASIGPAGQRVQIIVLDCRWFRARLRATDARNAPGKERYLPDPDPGKTMLGTTQWRWLEQQLAQPADVRLVVSGVQVLAKGHGWESWGNLPLERERLLETVQRTRANGVVFLSGDRHIGAFYREERPGTYALLEMTSSGLTHAWAQASEAGPNRLGELVTQNHYATIEFDWQAGNVVLSIKNVLGRVLRRQVLGLAELG